VKIASNLPPGLPDVVIDAAKTEQVVMNPLSNTLKLTKSGGTIMVEAGPHSEEGLTAEGQTKSNLCA
jgi:signal transduction histidine kinase